MRPRGCAGAVIRLHLRSAPLRRNGKRCHRILPQRCRDLHQPCISLRRAAKLRGRPAGSVQSFPRRQRVRGQRKRRPHAQTAPPVREQLVYIHRLTPHRRLVGAVLSAQSLGSGPAGPVPWSPPAAASSPHEGSRQNASSRQQKYPPDTEKIHSAPRSPTTAAARLTQEHVTSGSCTRPRAGSDTAKARPPGADAPGAAPHPTQHRSRDDRCSANAAIPAAPSQPCSDPTRYRNCRPTSGPAPRGCSPAISPCQISCSAAGNRR